MPIDIKKLKDFVLKRRSKDGGLAFCNPLPSSLPETFYAVYILDAIDVEIEDKEELVEFLLGKIYPNDLLRLQHPFNSST